MDLAYRFGRIVVLRTSSRRLSSASRNISTECVYYMANQRSGGIGQSSPNKIRIIGKLKRSQQVYMLQQSLSCVLTMNQNQVSYHLRMTLLKEATRSRILHDYQNHPRVDSLMVSFFLHTYHSNLHLAIYLCEVPLKISREQSRNIRSLL